MSVSFSLNYMLKVVNTPPCFKNFFLFNLMEAPNFFASFILRYANLTVWKKYLKFVRVNKMYLNGIIPFNWKHRRNQIFRTLESVIRHRRAIYTVRFFDYLKILRFQPFNMLSIIQVNHKTRLNTHSTLSTTQYLVKSTLSFKMFYIIRNYSYSL